MANNSKKYISLSKLSTFLDNLKDKFATTTHKHTMSDITDYKVDDSLSATSINPVQNKVIDAEFEAVSAAMNALDLAIDGKADASHKHDSLYDTKGAASTVQTNLDVVSDKLDTHTTNSDIHVTTTNKSNWNTAYTHSQSTHARTDATKVADSSTNGNILINGTETNVYTHPNSGVTAGTYKSVTVNAQGHITAGTNPTTLAGYGITDGETKGAASSALASAKEYTDTIASGKANTSHNHDTAYDKKGSADSALASAKTYADSAATTAANTVKNDLLNGAGGAYDTLKELGDLIVDNQDAIDALETVAAGKADKTHSHAISDVNGLQSALDGKAASSHGTHVSYSTTAPVMDGTASAGSASTVARSDHKHPTDTSRASKTEFDTHTSNTTAHITSTERSNWNAAKTHADSAHAPSNAQPNQNAFSNIVVGSTTIAADSVTDTVTLVAGSNITIAPDATNDTITISSTSDMLKSVYDIDNDGIVDNAEKLGGYTPDKFVKLNESNSGDLSVSGTTISLQGDGNTSSLMLDLDYASLHGDTYFNISTNSTSILSDNSDIRIHAPNGALYFGEIDENEEFIPSTIYANLDGTATNATYATNAANATKLASARKIGNASFDGTADITLADIAGRAITKTSGGSYANYYTKFARIDVSSGAYTDCCGTLEFCSTETPKMFGELLYYIRTRNSITSTEVIIYWKTLTNINYANRVSAVQVSDGIYDLYYQPSDVWETVSITNVNCTNPSKITLYSNQDYIATITAAATSSLCNISSSATNAVSADTATNVASQGVASANVYRHVWFSDNNTETKRNHNDNFTYNPATNTLNVGAITGAASEAYLAWGGKHISNGFSPLDAALIDELGANRLAGISNDKVVFERSSDAGVTWSTYSSNGSALCTTSGWASNEKTGSALSANDWHRITIDVDGSIYCDLRKIAIFFSTLGASDCQCKVEWGDYSSSTVWTTATTTPISGWSGWNIINVDNRIGSSTYGNARYVRLTFSQTAVSSDYDFCSIVYKLRFYSSNCWGTPSTLADTGHLYSYDDTQNATFPATVTASKFVGNASGLNINFGSGGYKFDQYGNFTPDEIAQEWHIYDTSSNAMLTVGWKTGNVVAAGTVRAADFINHNGQAYATQGYVSNAIANAITTTLSTPV